MPRIDLKRIPCHHTTCPEHIDAAAETCRLLRRREGAVEARPSDVELTAGNRGPALVYQGETYRGALLLDKRTVLLHNLEKITLPIEYLAHNSQCGHLPELVLGEAVLPATIDTAYLEHALQSSQTPLELALELWPPAPRAYVLERNPLRCVEAHSASTHLNCPGQPQGLIRLAENILSNPERWKAANLLLQLARIKKQLQTP